MASGWQDLGKTLIEGLRDGMIHSAFVNFVRLDRAAAVQQISSVVDRSSGRELAAYEEWFLWNCSRLIEPELKRRATELYGWLKVKHYIRYGDFAFPDEHEQ